MHCRHCGKIITDDSKFCKHCGQNIEESNTKSIMKTPEETQTQYFKNSEVSKNDEELEFERYAENMVKRKIVGVVFRIIFWLSGLYFMYISCFYSWVIGDIFIMILKIVFFPFTIAIWPIIGLISGGLSGWIFWVWLFMMGSYSISTFYGKLRPIF